MKLLSVKNIRKEYKETVAVSDISFEINKGEILGLLGPNGAGKSTTISMIATLLKPTKGSIIFKGKDINKYPNFIREKMGYVPQEIALYPTLTGKENLMFWGKSYGIKGDELKQRINEISNIIGLKEKLSQKVCGYSGGMKRRLNIGVALLHRPELLIMDEPTVGIDPQSRKHILDTVKELNKKGMAIIYTSHYMDEIEYLCDTICIVDNGEILIQGTKDSILNKYDKIKKIAITFEGQIEKTLEQLKKIDTVKHVEVVNNEIRLEIIDENNILQSVLDVMHENKVIIRDIKSDVLNLESVFLELTGKELRD